MKAVDHCRPQTEEIGKVDAKRKEIVFALVSWVIPTSVCSGSLAQQHSDEWSRTRLVGDEQLVSNALIAVMLARNEMAATRDRIYTGVFVPCNRV